MYPVNPPTGINAQLSVVNMVADRARVSGMTREQKIQWMQEMFVTLSYMTLSREEKGVVRMYLQQVTGYSRAQITRYLTALQISVALPSIPNPAPAEVPVVPAASHASFWKRFAFFLSILINLGIVVLFLATVTWESGAAKTAQLSRIDTPVSSSAFNP